MIDLLNVNEPGGRDLIEAFARLERTPDFKLILTKLRFERNKVQDFVCKASEEVPLRQYQGGYQVLDDFIKAAETARNLL